MNTYPKSSYSTGRALMVAALLIGAASATAQEVKVGAYVQAHDVMFSGSGRRATSTAENLTPSGANLRRAGLTVKGDLGREDLTFVIDYRLSGLADNVTSAANGGSSHLQRGYITYACDNWHLSVGQMYVPFGMENTTASTNQLFMENSSLQKVMTTRNWVALNAGVQDAMFTANLSLAKAGLGGTDTNNSDKNAITFRGTVAPLQGDTGTVHFGVNAHQQRYNTITSTRGTAAAAYAGVSLRPELRSRNSENATSFILWGTTGSEILKRSTVYGVEVAGAYDAFTVQGEYLRRTNIYTSTSAKQKASGWYAQAAYVITGEARMYDHGVFKDPKPANVNTGAWEAAFRYSSLTANKNTVGTSVQGGKQKAWTAGVNYFVTNNLKLQANYVATKFSFQSGDPSRKVNGFGAGVQFVV